MALYKCCIIIIIATNVALTINFREIKCTCLAVVMAAIETTGSLSVSYVSAEQTIDRLCKRCSGYVTSSNHSSLFRTFSLLVAIRTVTDPRSCVWRCVQQLCGPMNCTLQLSATSTNVSMREASSSLIWNNLPASSRLHPSLDNLDIIIIITLFIPFT